MQSIVQDVYHSSQVLHKSAHFHDCHQIILVINGEVDFFVNDKRLHASRGDIAIFSRYENHSALVCSKEYERFVLHIDPNVVNRKSSVYSLLTDRPTGFLNVISVLENMDEITNIFKSILAENATHSKLTDEMVQLLVKQLLIMIYRCTQINYDTTFDDVVVSIKRSFENEYEKHYSLETLAKEYNMSISSLSHRFQASTGVAVMEYLQSCRIANAKQMLAQTDISVGAIVERCGFSDNSNFSRTFKKLTGLSPSTFRKKYKAR